jgi:hypothetical protein
VHQYTAKRFCRGGLVGIVAAKSTADPRDETDRELAGGSTASSAVAPDGTTDAESHRGDRRRPAPRAIAAGTPRASDRRDLKRHTGKTAATCVRRDKVPEKARVPPSPDVPRSNVKSRCVGYWVVTEVQAGSEVDPEFGPGVNTTATNPA